MNFIVKSTGSRERNIKSSTCSISGQLKIRHIDVIKINKDVGCMNSGHLKRKSKFL